MAIFILNYRYGILLLQLPRKMHYVDTLCPSISQVTLTANIPRLLNSFVIHDETSARCSRSSARTQKYDEHPGTTAKPPPVPQGISPPHINQSSTRYNTTPHTTSICKYMVPPSFAISTNHVHISRTTAAAEFKRLHEGLSGPGTLPPLFHAVQRMRIRNCSRFGEVR